MEYWGKELILDCSSCDVDLVTSKANIEAFAISLVDRINMIRHGGPQVVHFGEDNKQGYTLVQLITTSNIVAHFCDDSGDGYINVFSCAEFEIETVLDVIKQFFAPLAINYMFIGRDAKVNTIDLIAQGRESYVTADVR